MIVVLNAAGLLVGALLQSWRQSSCAPTASSWWCWFGGLILTFGLIVKALL